MSELVWSPTIEFVKHTIANEGKLRLIIAPFIKLDALKSLVSECRDISSLQVVVRWAGADLVSGASDIEIYPYLKEMGVPLFVHDLIHLKVLVYNRSLAFHTSGNVTKRGLGLIPRSNVEIGCAVTLDNNDWRNLFGILALSLLVDDAVYNQALDYTKVNRLNKTELPPLTLTPSVNKLLSTNSLPASSDPEQLYLFYAGQLSHAQTLEESPEFVHDLLVYSMPSGLDEDEFFKLLGRNFRSNQFVSAIVDFIRQEQSVRFGGVNAWIADNCSDTPRPYRRDLKTATRHLYNWLSFFYDEISWDKPNYSMVIYGKR